MYKVEQIENFIFFDGVKSFEVNKTYPNGLTSIDYEKFGNSYINYQNCKLNLFEKAKSLSEWIDDSLPHGYFNKEELHQIAKDFDLEIYKYKEDFTIALYKKGHTTGFQWCEKNNLICIYNIEGSRFPEGIYIHGLWQKIEKNV